MTTIVFRTLFIYFFLVLTMRLMGKRQIGELEITELVTTLLLSEIASLPITNLDIPVSYALIPMVFLLTLEVGSAMILTRLPRWKWLVSAKPCVILQHGKLDQRAMADLRLSVEELMTEVRGQGLVSLSQVECAILEKNGKLTILPKAAYRPPSAGELGFTVPDEPLMHLVWCSGVYNDDGLSLIGKDRGWLDAEIAGRGLSLGELFVVTADENGSLYWVRKEGKK